MRVPCTVMISCVQTSPLAVQQTLVDDLEDASNELMLVDEEEVCTARQCFLTALPDESFAFESALTTVQVRYVIGACFCRVNKDSAEEKLQEGGQRHKEAMECLGCSCLHLS